MASFVELDSLTAGAGDERVPGHPVLLGRKRPDRAVAKEGVWALRVGRAAVDLAREHVVALVGRRGVHVELTASPAADRPAEAVAFLDETQREREAIGDVRGRTLRASGLPSFAFAWPSAVMTVIITPR